ncbi:MAG TPA: hypothetical protein VFQ61_13315 [Polyangiaceae bacterium]|nr:hypothetical protein [Polyangiaceae bacterium]
MRQQTLTVVMPVRGTLELREALRARAALHEQLRQLLAQPALGIHFARLAFLDEPEAGKHPSCFVFESNFDTKIADPREAMQEHLRALCELGTPAIADWLHYSESKLESASGRALADYLERHLVEATACYQGHVQRDLGRIRAEQALRDVIFTYLEGCSGHAPHVLYRKIREHVRERATRDPRLSGLDFDAPAPAQPDLEARSRALKSPVWPWIRNSDVLLPAVLRLGRVAVWGKTDSYYELRKRQEAWTDRDREVFRDISRTEDFGAQNAITHVVSLRDGDGRLGVMRTAHRYIARLAERYFNDVGQLGGIPSIHFAKWLLLDGGKRLLFLSNYDSSWESYLGDFVDQAWIGLNLAWSCTAEYPATRHLVLGGAMDEERFKAWGRSCQRPTELFYSAYPDLSVAAINNNTAIRAGLHAPAPPDLDAWFRRLT